VAPGELLDTNIVLHATREGSKFSRSVDMQFELTASRFRPAICEVSVAELKAFALAWGQRRREKLLRVIESMLVVEISESGVHDRWADL
jgi:predicted nucleic acid-binding protein